MNFSIGTELRLNSGFALQQNNQKLMNGLAKPGSVSFGAEKKLMLNNINNQLLYKASFLIEESQKKQEEENIKRSFSTFA